MKKLAEYEKDTGHIQDEHSGVNFGKIILQTTRPITHYFITQTK